MRPARCERGRGYTANSSRKKGFPSPRAVIIPCSAGEAEAGNSAAAKPGRDGMASASTAAPQASRNRAVVGYRAPHWPHARGSSAPQPAQNFARTRFSKLQCGRSIEGITALRGGGNQNTFVNLPPFPAASQALRSGSSSFHGDIWPA